MSGIIETVKIRTLRDFVANESIGYRPECFGWMSWEATGCDGDKLNVKGGEVYVSTKTQSSAPGGAGGSTTYAVEVGGKTYLFPPENVTENLNYKTDNQKGKDARKLIVAAVVVVILVYAFKNL